MARGLDHIVHAVRDLDAAAELYRRGVIELTTPAGFERRFGLPAPDILRGPRLAGLRFSGHALAAGRHFVLGAVLVFEPG